MRVRDRPVQDWAPEVCRPCGARDLSCPFHPGLPPWAYTFAPFRGRGKRFSRSGILHLESFILNRERNRELCRKLGDGTDKGHDKACDKGGIGLPSASSST